MTSVWAEILHMRYLDELDETEDVDGAAGPGACDAVHQTPGRDVSIP